MCIRDRADIDAGSAITNTATSAATTPGGFTPVDAVETITADAPAPASTLRKVGSNDKDVQVG